MATKWKFLLPVVSFVFAIAAAPTRGTDRVDFTRDVRPILSDHCFRCHGPDEASREAGLRLDQEQGLFADRGDQTAVRPGDAAGSEIIRRALSRDVDEVMPPPAVNKPLTDVQKQTLVRWIEQGAKWERHWSFVKPARSALPMVKNADWCRNEIDRFILAKLEAAGITPATEAKPYILLRRLYLDLIGLPPTPVEAELWGRRIWGDTFATRPQAIDETAYEELVQELLSSSHYGERWARRWLDLARYADTNGYEKDRDRSIWPFRDWVIRAINQGMPFDQFTVEQLAGDMLPSASMDQRVATGFHRNTMLNEEGGIDPLEFRYHAMTDRVATTGTTWLGLTLGCCQCHTHKYDPVSHREYFQVMALLNNADEPSLELPDSIDEQRWLANKARADELLASLVSKWAVSGEEPKKTLEERRSEQLNLAFNSWRTAEQSNAVAWTPLTPVNASSSLPMLTIQNDKSIFASGDTAKRDDYIVEFAAVDSSTMALRLEALPDARLPARGPGSTYYEGTLGDFFLTEIHVTAGGKKFRVQSASETFSRNRFGKNPASASESIDGDIQTGWSVHGRQGERHVAVFFLQEPVPAGQPIRVQMSFGRHFASSLGRFRFSTTDANSEPQARTYDNAFAKLLKQPLESLSTRERTDLMQTFLLSSSELAEEAESLRKLRQRTSAKSTLVLAERPHGNQRPTFRHHRGEYLQPRERVTGGLPAVLLTRDGAQPRNRLEFANWLVSDVNPLTSRVVVNRQWATIFGTGIVTTVDDFGLQGETPSHPALLDWLAVTFAENDGWSIKALHRRIVSSATYRQSTATNGQGGNIDSTNRLLSYSPRYRLDAEVIRDELLVAAGVLSRQLGGPPVRPPQPNGVTDVAYGNPKWKASEGDDRYRRSLYTFSKRTAPFAMFNTFDAPSGEACVARRNRSNSPLQALTLLNDVMLMDLCRKTGQQLVDENAPENVKAGLSNLFQRVLVRLPTDDERRLLLEFYSARLEQLQKSPEQSADFLGEDPAVTPPATPDQASEIAAWSATARALFGLDETLTRP